MKIGVQAVSEVREGKVRRRSVRHDHGIGIDVGINVEVRSDYSSRSWGIDIEVRSESWVASASGFWLCFLGLVKYVLMGFVVGC